MMLSSYLSMLYQALFSTIPFGQFEVFVPGILLDSRFLIHMLELVESIDYILFS